MSEWKTVRLGDVCEIVNGFAFDSKLFNTDKKGIPLIRIRDVIRGFSETYTTENADSRFLVKVGDLLIGMDGEFNCSLWKSEDSFLNQRVCKIVPNLELINKDYVYYGLKGKLKEIEDKTSFVTVKHISSKQIENIVLKYPPLETQKQIAVQLDKCTALIAKHKQILEKYDILIKSRFIEMFGDITTGNYKFETRKLGSVSEVGSSHRVFTTEFVEQGVPFYRGTEIGMLANGQQPEEPFYISEEHYNRLTEHDSKPKIGDLLMPSICNKGQVWMVDTDTPFYYKDGRVLSISPNQKIYNSKYLQYFKREKTIVEYPKLGSGSTFAEFKIFLLKDIDVLTPPISLQNTFASFVQQIDKSKFAVQKSLEKAETLYKSLMQEYFG